MLEEEELIGNPVGLAVLDELLLQLERLAVLDDAEPANFQIARSDTVRAQSHASSKPSSRSLTKARNRPASAPSMSRWS